MKGFFIFCVAVGMLGIIYSLCLSWERIQALQQASIECSSECEHHFPAP